MGDVVSVVTHLVEEMYDHVHTLNEDIDRLTVMRDRMNAAILALVPPGDTLPTESARPGITQPTPTPAPAKPTPQRNRVSLDVTQPAPKGARVKHDLVGVATVAMAAFVDGRSMSKAVATVLDVSEATAFSLLAKARAAGHAIPKKSSGGRKAAAPASDAITPAQIRHEVEPTPEDRKVPVPEHTTPIIGPTGFASRPTQVEQPAPRPDAWSPDRAREAIESGAA